MIFKLHKETNTCYYAAESTQPNSLLQTLRVVSVWAFYFTMTTALVLFLLYLTNDLPFLFFPCSFGCNLEEMSKNEDSIQLNKALSEEMHFKELLLSLLDVGYDIFAVAVQELNKEERKL